MAISVFYLLWSIPVLVAVSLVMAATRHERWDLIKKQAWSSALWTLTFLGGIALALGVAMWWIG
ncbi:MAG: hypothetical protein ACKOAU_19125 [Pirellula sp.]